MKNIYYFLISLLFIFSSCIKNHDDFTYNYDKEKQEVRNNMISIFGVEFSENQDWKSTLSNSIEITANDDNYTFKAVRLVVVDNSDKDNISIKLLNECNIKNGETKKLVYDIPYFYNNLYAIFLTENNVSLYKKFSYNDKELYFNNITRGLKREIEVKYHLPDIDLVISDSVETFASQRNWLPGEHFYIYNYQYIDNTDYNDEYKTLIRDVIFNYFPNGRKYNNLPKVQESGYYNETSYLITKEDEPIILSPIYKNDGGYNEVTWGEIYYYYFKEDNLTVKELEALPKYKAIQLNDIYTNDMNDEIAKTKSYALVYWGDGKPDSTTTGTYVFPKGYKIGFIYKSNTTVDNNKKQGELYCDGRLNYNINNWGNFKTSGLGKTEPRMGWVTVSDKIFLCIESGTDKDFNDLIIEVEGGYEFINVLNKPENQFYTFCYEDNRIGDYDMNDIVLKGSRLDETHVEWTLMACGAYDELYIYNVDGKNIKSDIEVHKLFNLPNKEFINTVNKNAEFIIDTVEVSKDFSFLDEDTQPYIYDKTKNWIVKISRKGEDPHAIMIPYDFKWPREIICVKDAYKRFNSWGIGYVEDTNWYKYPEENKVFEY